MGLLNSAYQKIYGPKDFAQQARFRAGAVFDTVPKMTAPTVPTQGVVLDRLVLIDEDDRNSSYQLESGSATSYTDAWTRAAISSYVPVGVKALYLHGFIRLNGDASTDEARVEMRKNGSAISGDVVARMGGQYSLNHASGGIIGNDFEVMAQLCDEQGIVEYLASTAQADIWLMIRGYWL